MSTATDGGILRCPCYAAFCINNVYGLTISPGAGLSLSRNKGKPNVGKTLAFSLVYSPKSKLAVMKLAQTKPNNPG